MIGGAGSWSFDASDAAREFSQTAARSRLVSQSEAKERTLGSEGKESACPLVVFFFFFLIKFAYVAVRWLAPAMNGFLHARELVRQFFFSQSCSPASEGKPRGGESSLFGKCWWSFLPSGATVSDVEAILKSAGWRKETEVD